MTAAKSRTEFIFHIRISELAGSIKCYYVSNES